MNGNVVLEGNLKFLSLADVVQLLGTIDAIGILCLRSKYNQNTGLIYFINGDPINAENGELTGLDAFYSLFGWIEGEFQFSEEVVKSERMINKSGMGIIMEALRLLDDGIVEKQGPVSLADRLDSEKGKLQLVKGPVIDYTYVVAEETFVDGDKIVMEKAHGRWMWVVLEGYVDIIKESDHGDIKLLRICSGAFIGSLSSFLFQGSIRNATAIAVGKVVLGVLDSQRLDHEYALISSRFRDLLVSIDNRLKLVTNGAVKIDKVTHKIERFISHQKPIIKQGNRFDKLYLLTEGKAFVVRYTENRHHLLAVLSPGDYFGSIPFVKLDHEPYSASIYKTKDLKIQEVDPMEMMQEYKRLSPTVKNIIEHTGTCISVTSSLSCKYQKKS
jgi:CRP-like cAMP-binding protein